MVAKQTRWHLQIHWTTCCRHSRRKVLTKGGSRGSGVRMHLRSVWIENTVSDCKIPDRRRYIRTQNRRVWPASWKEAVLFMRLNSTVTIIPLSLKFWKPTPQRFFFFSSLFWTEKPMEIRRWLKIQRLVVNTRYSRLITKRTFWPYPRKAPL